MLEMGHPYLTKRPENTWQSRTSTFGVFIYHVFTHASRYGRAAGYLLIFHHLKLVFLLIFPYLLFLAQCFDLMWKSLF